MRVRRKPSKLTPWFDAECGDCRRRTRALECRYRRTRKQADRLAWRKQLKTMRALYEDKSHQYWNGKIKDCKGSCKGEGLLLRGGGGKGGERRGGKGFRCRVVAAASNIKVAAAAATEVIANVTSNSSSSSESAILLFILGHVTP